MELDAARYATQAQMDAIRLAPIPRLQGREINQMWTDEEIHGRLVAERAIMPMPYRREQYDELHITQIAAECARQLLLESPLNQTRYVRIPSNYLINPQVLYAESPVTPEALSTSDPNQRRDLIYRAVLPSLVHHMIEEIRHTQLYAFYTLPNYPHYGRRRYELTALANFDDPRSGLSIQVSKNYDEREHCYIYILAVGVELIPQ